MGLYLVHLAGDIECVEGTVGVMAVPPGGEGPILDLGIAAADRQSALNACHLAVMEV